MGFQNELLLTIRLFGYQSLWVGFDGCQVVLIPVEVTDILPVNDITNLELEIISRHGTFEEVVDDFTWILPDLKTLSLTLGSTTKFFQVIYSFNRQWHCTTHQGEIIEWMTKDKILVYEWGFDCFSLVNFGVFLFLC